MIDNDVLVSAVDAAFSVDYAKMYRSGVNVLFYSDGVHRGVVSVKGATDAEVVQVASLGPAIGADQLVLVSGAVYSQTMPDATMDPAAIPTLAYLAARRDVVTAYYRRLLSMADDGSMSAIGDLARRPHNASRWAALVVVPWVMEQPEGDVGPLVASLGERGHKVVLL